MRRTLLSFLLIFFVLSVQAIDLNKLEKEIYHNNQAGKHKQSQSQLLSLLDDRQLTDVERVTVNFLLANTYRSINDYATTIKYLEIADSMAQNLGSENDSLKMRIQSEMAFNYFDNKNYNRANKIMQKISLQKFKDVDAVDKAYIIMQMGYVKYLSKDFRDVDKMYDESLLLLHQYSPCNMPVVLVKKMQLYGSQKMIEKAEKIFEKCLKIADSCNILKYKIYATEELVAIYKKEGENKKIYKSLKLLDSLKTIDNRDDRLTEMRITNQEFVKQGENQEEQTSLWIKILFFALAVFLLIFVIVFYLRSKRIHKEKKVIDAELLDMKRVLENYSQTKKEVLESSNSKYELMESKLTERQRELLQLMSNGLSNKEIAEKLFISENTVKYHIKNIYIILELKDRKDLLLKMRPSKG